MKLKIMFTPPICYSVASALFMAIATLLLSMLSAFAFCIGNCLRVNNLEILNFPAQHAREEIHVSNFEPEEFYWRDLTQASSNKN